MYSVRVIIIFVYIRNIMFFASKKTFNIIFLINKLNASNLPPYEYSYLFTNQWWDCPKNVLIIYTPIPLQPFSHMWRVDREWGDISINWKLIWLAQRNKMPTGPNGHLSNRYFTLTSCQKGSYLYINNPIIE